MSSDVTIEHFQGLFEAHGNTDFDYLRHHFPRWAQTKQRLLSHWDRGRGNRVLDIGAHWLHQSMLYAIDGFDVTALDLPGTLESASVQALARAHAIELLPNADLEHPAALKPVPDNTFDLVLFTEIIEHIAFNPVAMWREIYRVMRPGARILITTPNYYALRARVWHWNRFRKGLGGGLNPQELLTRHTLAHHWKEYALRELIYYFSMLSPDFDCVHSEYIEEYHPSYLGKPARAWVRWLERAIPIFRPDVHLEIEIARKDKGIVVEPHW
jgi:2-polyprenyl-6-hydroxyphenyl methylase/3-demethylubiquinone-9 3-methyltransferase